MVTQTEKDALITALNTLIADYGNKYAIGLKYGLCKNEQDLFIASSYKNMLDYYSVFNNDVKEIYTFTGGDITIDDGVPVVLNGTIEEIAWEIINQSLSIGLSIIIDDVLYLAIYDNQNTVITGDVEDGYCATCLLDKINCCTTEEMYKIYDKYICNSNCPTETNIP